MSHTRPANLVPVPLLLPADEGNGARKAVEMVIMSIMALLKGVHTRSGSLLQQIQQLSQQAHGLLVRGQQSLQRYVGMIA